MFFAAKHRAEEREHKGRAWQAWHTAILPLLKKFPKLGELTGAKKAGPTQTPWKVQQAAAQAWHRRISGAAASSRRPR